MTITWQFSFERAPPLFCPFGAGEAAVGMWAIFSRLSREWGMGPTQVKMAQSQTFFLIKCSTDFCKPLIIRILKKLILKVFVSFFIAFMEEQIFWRSLLFSSLPSCSWHWFLFFVFFFLQKQ